MPEDASAVHEAFGTHFQLLMTLLGQLNLP